jgi:hypothetical protein
MKRFVNWLLPGRHDAYGALLDDVDVEEGEEAPAASPEQLLPEPTPAPPPPAAAPLQVSLPTTSAVATERVPPRPHLPRRPEVAVGQLVDLGTSPPPVAPPRKKRGIIRRRSPTQHLLEAAASSLATGDRTPAVMREETRIFSFDEESARGPWAFDEDLPPPYSS